MKIITVEFITPEKEIFKGTATEITKELYRRTLIYGSCSYKTITPTNYLYLVKTEEG